MQIKMLKILKHFGFMLFMIILFMQFFDCNMAKAAGSVSVKEINYENSTITVQMGQGDTALLISDEKQKKWETVTIEPEAGIVVMDISWIPLTKDYVLSLKGDVNSTAVKVTIPKQNSAFKATYSPIAGISFTGNESGAKIQWKKKEGVTWSLFPDNPADFNDKLSGMIAKGCSIMFRTAPENGDGSSAGRRASKEVTVSVKARTAAPSITINNSKMTIPLKKNMEYRYCDENGNVKEGTNWNSVDANEDRALSSIAGEAMANGNNAGKNVYIQFRLTATAKTQISNITTVTIPGQKPLTEEEKNGISIVYTSPSAFELKVASAKDKEQFEYCIITNKDVDEGITIGSTKELTWITIPDNKPITISKTTAGEGSKLYVRKKAKGKQGDENYAIPSTYFELPSIKYPKELSTLTSELIWMQGIAGMCRTDNAGGYMTFYTYSSMDAPISAIKLVYKDDPKKTFELDASEFTSEVRTLSSAELSQMSPSEKEDYKYYVTTTIKDTTKIESLMTDRKSKEFYVYFKQGNSVDYTVSDETDGGVAIYLFPKTIVSNPDAGDTAEVNLLESKKVTKITGDSGSYLTQFTRIYGSNNLYMLKYSDIEKCDLHVFSFVLDLGSKYIPKSDSIGEVSNTEANVEKLVFDGIEFRKDDLSGGKPYFVTNFVDYTENGEEKRKIIVTVDTNAMEKNSQIKPKGEFAGLSIYLNNGEIVREPVQIKFEKTGVVVDKEGDTAEANKTITIMGRIDTTSNQENDSDVFETVIIYLSESTKAKSVEIDKVYYDGSNVCKSIKKTNNYIKIELSKKLLNNIIDGYHSKTSKYLFIYFSNGYVLTEGYKIIIIP